MIQVLGGLLQGNINQFLVNSQIKSFMDEDESDEDETGVVK